MNAAIREAQCVVPVGIRLLRGFNVWRFGGDGLRQLSSNNATLEFSKRKDVSTNLVARRTHEMGDGFLGERSVHRKQESLLHETVVDVHE